MTHLYFDLQLLFRKNFQCATKDYTKYPKRWLPYLYHCFIFFHLKQHFHSGIYLLSYPLLIKEHPPFTFHFKWLVASRFSPHYLHKALCLTAHVKVEKRKHLGFEKSKYCKNKGIKHGFYFSTDSDSIVQLSFVT